MLARKPRMLVIVALANKMARTVWALLARNGVSTELPPWLHEQAVGRRLLRR